ncbi:MAG: Rieske 2Fe-2S domain-containing protein [Candidatus Binatia bacterium]
MADFVKVATVSDVAPGSGKVVNVNGKDVALFNAAGRFFAIDNECPHRGGPLGEGELDGTTVTCPWHNWQFDLASGESLTDDTKVACFQVKLDGDAVLVSV